MSQKVLSGGVKILFVGWLVLVGRIASEVLYSQLWLTPDMRVDQRFVMQPNPLIQPIVLAPYVGKRLVRIGNEQVTSLQDLRRASRRKPLELWLQPDSSDEPFPVLWAFARYIPDLRL